MLVFTSYLVNNLKMTTKTSKIVLFKLRWHHSSDLSRPSGGKRLLPVWCSGDCITRTNTADQGRLLFDIKTGSYQVRKRKTVLDSGFHSMDSRFLLTVEFRIPWAVFGISIPGFWIPHVKFPGFLNPDSLTNWIAVAKLQSSICGWRVSGSLPQRPLPSPHHLKESQSATREEIMDQFRFLGNCPPTPPLTQHFAPSEK